MIDVHPLYFLIDKFATSNVNTKTFVLMLAQARPHNFISDTPIDLSAKLKAYNRTEFHHLFPRAYLQSLGSDLRFDVNCLANFTFLSSIENKRLGGQAPEAYRKLMPEDVSRILRHALCPPDLFTADFDMFVQARATLLAYFARTLCVNGSVDLEAFCSEPPVGQVPVARSIPNLLLE